MEQDIIYLETYTLQSDSRIRLPKSAVENLQMVPGKTKIRIYLNPQNKALTLQVVDDNMEDNTNA